MRLGIPVLPSEFSLHAEIEDSHWWFAGRRAILFELLRGQIPPGQGHLLAEIGCGTGGNLKFLGAHYAVMGADLSEVALSYARQRVDCPLYFGDHVACFAPFWPEIDAVLLLDVLEHVADDRDFLRRIASSMRPGAILLLTVPANPLLWSQHDHILGHLRRYTRRGLRHLWQELPLKEHFLSPFNTLLFPPIAAYRSLGFGKFAAGKSDLSPVFPPLNRLLTALFAAERHWLRHAPLPFGCSLCAVLEKVGHD